MTKQDPATLGPATITGVANWRAWQRPPLKEQLASDAGAWLLYCPGAHAFWSYWFLAAVSLAELPGIPPATKHFADATHEVMIWSFDPDHQISIEAFRQGRWDANQEHPAPLLQPADLVHQVHLPSDELATHLLELMARDIMQGRISPDVDYRRAWHAMLNITAARLRAEHA